MTHTAAPWVCDERGYIKAVDGTVIAQVAAVEDADESVSNGFVLAASVELLEALVEDAEDRP